MPDLQTSLAISVPGGRRFARAEWRETLSRPATATQRTSFYVVLAIVCAVTCAVLAAIQRPIAFPLDDAYITLHNARVLLSGTDPNYPGTPALVGATSPIHLALVASLMLMFPPLSAAYLAGALAIVAYATGLARFAFQNGGSILSATALVVAGTLTGYASYHLLNGLETGLAMAAVVWVLVFASARNPSLAVPLISGALPFIRPELAALSLVLMARQTILRLRRRDDLRQIVADLAVVALMAAPWLIWQWSVLGTAFLPTASAKAAFFSEASAPPVVKALTMLAGIAQAGILPLFVLFLARVRTSLSIMLALFVLAVCAAFYETFPGGLAQNWSRYTFVLLPVFLCGIAERQGGDRRSVALNCVLLGFAIATAYQGAAAYVMGAAWTRTELAAVAQWVNENVPAGEPVLIHDAGFPAFATAARLVDLVGLKTPESAAVHKRLTATDAGRRGDALREIARRSQARYAVILNDKEHWWGKLADELGRDPALTVLRVPPSGVGYVVYRLPPRAE